MDRLRGSLVANEDGGIVALREGNPASDGSLRKQDNGWIRPGLPCKDLQLPSGCLRGCIRIP